MRREHPHESSESLWWLVASPTIWAVHLLASYITVALWCAKVASPEGPLGAARMAIAVYTVAGLAGVIAIGWQGYQRHTFGPAPGTRDFDTPAERHRFLGFATLLLSGLSAVAIVYQALAAVFIGTCA